MLTLKTVLKYGKFFLFLALASMAALAWPGRSTHTSVVPDVIVVHADVPGSGGEGEGEGGGGGDCDGGGDCG